MEDFVDPAARGPAVPDRRRLHRARDKVVDVPLDGPGVPRFPEVARDVRTSGLRFALLPPGETVLKLETTASIIDVNLNAVPHRLGWNSDRLVEEGVPADSLAFIPQGGEIKVEVTNVLPGLVVEIEPSSWPESLREAFEFADGPSLGSGFGGDVSTRRAVDFLGYEHDPVAAELGRAGLRLLMEDHWTGERADALALEGIAMGLIGRVAGRLAGGRRGGRSAPAPSALPRRKLRLVTEYVEANLHETIQVADLAELVAMSVSHFARCFRLAMGVSPARYVVLRRIERTKLMLTHRDDLSIAEIAFVCGFSGQAHLTRVFKDVTGMTPGAARKGAG